MSWKATASFALVVASCALSPSPAHAFRPVLGPQFTIRCDRATGGVEFLVTSPTGPNAATLTADLPVASSGLVDVCVVSAVTASSRIGFGPRPAFSAARKQFFGVRADAGTREFRAPGTGRLGNAQDREAPFTVVFPSAGTFRFTLEPAARTVSIAQPVAAEPSFVVVDVPQPLFSIVPGPNGQLPALACSPAVKSWRAPAGDGAKPIQEPRGISVSAQNDVFVATADDNKVKVFDGQGQFKRSIAFGTAKPSAVAAGDNGEVYVFASTTDQQQVRRYDRNAILLATTNLAGAVGSLPGGLTRARDGRIHAFVVSPDTATGNLKSEIVTLSASLAELSRFTVSTSFTPRFDTSRTTFALATDASGKLYLGGGSAGADISVFHGNGTVAQPTVSLADLDTAFGVEIRGLAVGDNGVMVVNDDRNGHTMQLKLVGNGKQLLNKVTIPEATATGGLARAPDGRIYIANNDRNENDPSISVVTPCL